MNQRLLKEFSFSQSAKKKASGQNTNSIKFNKELETELCFRNSKMLRSRQQTHVADLYLLTDI